MRLSTKISTLILAAAVALAFIGCGASAVGGGTPADSAPGAKVGEAEIEDGGVAPAEGSSEEESTTQGGERRSIEGVWKLDGYPCAFDSEYYYSENYVPVPYEMVADAEGSNQGAITFTFPDEIITANYDLKSDEEFELAFPETGGKSVGTFVGDDVSGFTSYIEVIKPGKEFANDDLLMTFSKPEWVKEVGYDYDEPITSIVSEEVDGATYLLSTGKLENYMNQPLTDDYTYHAYLLINGTQYPAMDVSSADNGSVGPLQSQAMFYYASISDKKMDGIESATMYIIYDGAFQEMAKYVFEVPLI